MQAATEVTIERDYYAWLCEQAARLRRHRPAFLDWANVAEELEEMGRNEVHALTSFIERLLVHLLKWAYSPGKRSGSWETSIENSRDEIEDRLRESPSLRGKLDELLSRAYTRARRTAGAQMKLTKHEWSAKLPPTCPWPIERVLDSEFWPEAEPENGKH